MTSETKSPAIDFSKKVNKAIIDAQTLFDTAVDISELDDGSIKSAQTTCAMVPEYIESGKLKIAVVGVIKSGKSTFVNSILGNERVKRGAGVMTSVTTRIRKGKKNRANIYFKSWDDINAHLQSVLELFPEELLQNNSVTLQPGKSFDLRRENDRAFLEQVYQSMTTDFSDLFEETRPETVLIHHALNGFESCKDIVGADRLCHCFESKAFDTHKQFTADSDKAFYIQDVCLELFGKTMDPNMEIADCQGADSTDPSQLAQVLNYLESANLIVYCISSRTGLRESDIALLHRIRRLGLTDHLIFINNCDLSEHENLDDLIKIERGIYQELSLINIRPRLFSFSSLYNLFEQMESRLNKKDSARFKLWQTDLKMTKYCDDQRNAFNLLFSQIVENDRHTLLVSNHLNRIQIMIKQLETRMDIFLDLLSSDQAKETKAVQTLEDLCQTASRLETIVANSLDSAVKGLKEQMTKQIHLFFKADEKELLQATQTFIKEFSLDVSKYKTIAKDDGFKQVFYLMFQDFKRQLDLFVLDQIRPEINRFIKIKEDEIVAYFQSLFDSYQIDLMSSEKTQSLMKDSNYKESFSNQEDFIDLESIKKVMGLTLPERIFTVVYSSSLKAKMLSDFWFQTFSGIFKSLAKQKTDFSFSPVLKKNINKIKTDNHKAVAKQFEQLGDQLNSSYLSPLIDAAIRDFEDKIDHRFKRYRSYQDQVQTILSLNNSDKENRHKAVLKLKKQTSAVLGQIQKISSYA